MPRGLLMAARAGNRMQARQGYRTINRMERRRGLLRDALTSPEPEPEPAPAPQAAVPDYVAELERLAALQARGALTADEYSAKKRQILGL